jgi:hypothetical protein
VIVANGGAGLWALAAARWPAARHRALWWFTGVAQVMVFVEVILGVWMMAGQDVEAPQFHTFYGFLAVIAVAIIQSYRQQLHHRLYLLYGLGGLFVMGLAIRAALLR